jgi:ABC-type transport system involved in multi-copper enzyme maturation permease subunit
MKNILAQGTIDFGPKGGGFTGPGTGIFAAGGNPATNFELLISRVIGVMTVIAGIWFIFTLLVGAIGWLTAGADKGAVEAARKRISNGLTGLIIVVISIFILSLVGRFLGFDILGLSNAITNLSK